MGSSRCCCSSFGWRHMERRLDQVDGEVVCSQGLPAKGPLRNPKRSSGNRTARAIPMPCGLVVPSLHREIMVVVEVVRADLLGHLGKSSDGVHQQALKVLPSKRLARHPRRHRNPNDAARFSENGMYSSGLAATRPSRRGFRLVRPIGRAAGHHGGDV